MINWVLYWRPETVKNDDATRPQWWAGSDWIGKDGVTSGDVLWVVTSHAPNDLRLVARIDVENVVHSRAEAVAIVGENAWSGAEHFAVGNPRTARPMQDIDLSDVARRLVFAGKRDRLPKDFDGKNFQRLRSLSSASAGVLQRAWDSGIVTAPPQFDWTRDEVILAMDLYFRHQKLPSSEKHPAIEELSTLIRALPIHPGRHFDPTFRNPNGVYLKITNLRALHVPGTGMKSVSKVDREVWEEFKDDLPRLRMLTEAIRAGHAAEVVKEPTDPDQDEGEFPEGRIAYRMHKHRERNATLVRRKKEQARSASNGKLACEACAFDFKVRYGDLGADFIECHHTIPISSLPAGAKTRLEDVALVCSNCHRMLHRRKPWLMMAELRSALVV
jgi:5-methylcytosine-specific restriction enzyme A